MFRTFIGILYTVGLVCVLLASGRTSFAGSFSCGQLVLKSASGVIGTKHSYTFIGTCSESWTYSTETSVNPLISNTSKNAGYTIQITGKATWDRATGAAKEVLKISGDVTGERTVNGICSLDPFLKDSPEGSSPCSGMNAGLNVTTGQLWKSMAESKGFWFSKSVLFVVAQGLSESGQSNAEQPPPPPPAPKSNIPKVSSSDQGALGGALQSAAPAGISPDAIVKERVQDVSNSSRRAVQGAISRIPSIPAADRSVPDSAASNSRQITEQVDAATQGLTKDSSAASSLPNSARGAAPVSVPERTAVPQPAQTPASSTSRSAGQPSPGTIRSLAQAMLLNMEGEDLAKNGNILVSGGQVTAQAMSGFGTGWSGNGQLFWSGGSMGAVLDLLINIPAAASYALELYPTRAPDYGQIKIQVDGQDAPVTVDGYSPQVMQPTPRQLGRFSLSQGEHKVRFMIVGKNPMASGYLVGIDRIRLYPSGPYSGGGN